MHRLLTFSFYIQLNDYSCGASVFRMALRYLRGGSVSHWQAEKITGCKPDGVTTARMRRELRKYHMRVGRVFKPGIRNLRKELTAEKLIVLDDYVNYNTPHWVLAIGIIGDMVILADPARGPVLRSLRDVRHAAREGFTVT